MRRLVIFTRHGCRLAIVSTLAALVLCAARPAAAAINLALSPATATVAAGSDDDAFDVTLTNTGPSSIDVAAFAFEFSTSSSYIDFTGATTSTTAAPYIFAGSSLFGPNITASATGGTLEASDISILSSGVTVAAGSTVGLGHILFNVSSLAPASVVPVTFEAYPSTSLTGPTGNNITINALLSGDIDIQPGTMPVVPEPSMIMIYSVGIGLAAVSQVLRKMHRA